MVPRIKRKGGAYFASTDSRFISTGCTLLDCVLGGGWVLGRISNIVGDKSTGKTLLAIEACANFARVYDGPIWYNEAESAFDKSYARSLGLPVERVQFVENCYTVEDLFSSLFKILETKYGSGLYILDSLDALSDRAEVEREFDKGSYGAEKAKQMSKLFRMLVQKLADNNICLIVISQVRDNIGVTFGRKTTRSGGRALDFYASQVLYLAQVGTIKRTVNKIARPVGVEVKAKCDKNKIGLPLRECQFVIKFGYGIDDVSAGVDWLVEAGVAGELFEATEVKDAAGFMRLYEREDDYDLASALREAVSEQVRKHWQSVEKNFAPSRKKYA